MKKGHEQLKINKVKYICKNVQLCWFLKEHTEIRVMCLLKAKIMREFGN